MQKNKKTPCLKPLFEERMKSLLKTKHEYEKFLKALETQPPTTIRCNTLKISPEKLKTRLNKKGWKIKQPFQKHPEIMIVEGKITAHKDSHISKNIKTAKTLEPMPIKSKKRVENLGKAKFEANNSERSRDNIEELKPGELGRSLEHMLGYYYVQELASMLPALSFGTKIKPGQRILDLAASPGSKTTQIAAKMENKGTLIANDISVSRIKILASNAERCGVANLILTKKEGASLCKNLEKLKIYFDKILIDAPCSGEGTLRTAPKTGKMWNIHTVRKLSRIQKNLVANAIKILKPGGEIIYSTCTHAPEENEEVIDFTLRNFKNINVKNISLPVKFRKGLTKWQDKTYLNDVKKTCRIYPHDNNTEGFFIAKLKKKG